MSKYLSLCTLLATNEHVVKFSLTQPLHEPPGQVEVRPRHPWVYWSNNARLTWSKSKHPVVPPFDTAYLLVYLVIPRCRSSSSNRYNCFPITVTNAQFSYGRQKYIIYVWWAHLLVRLTPYDNIAIVRSDITVPSVRWWPPKIPDISRPDIYGLTSGYEADNFRQSDRRL